MKFKNGAYSAMDTFTEKRPHSLTLQSTVEAEHIIKENHQTSH